MTTFAFTIVIHGLITSELMMVCRGHMSCSQAEGTVCEIWVPEGASHNLIGYEVNRCLELLG